jgi:hypothetical protein
MTTLNVMSSAVMLASLLLTACGGSSSSSREAEPTPKPTITTTKARPGLLIRASSGEALGLSLQQGLQNAGYTSGSRESILVAGIAFEGGDVAADSGAGQDRFTSTNVQEAGVDEADMVKYDGEVLYFVDRGQWSDTGVLQDAQVDELPVAGLSIVPAQHAPIIRLHKTDAANATASEVAQLSPPSDSFSIDGLYVYETLTGKELLAVGQTNAFVYWELFSSDYYWRNGRTSVQAWNVDSPEQPARSWSLEFDGSLLASRRIDDILYLVTRYSPTVEGIIDYPQTEADIAHNAMAIKQTPVTDLLPKQYREDGGTQELFEATDCYVPNAEYSALTVPPAGGSLITVSAIDLNAPDSVTSICLNTYASGFYVSTQALYITANQDSDATLIHKIALDDSGPEYRGSGQVPGYLGTSNPSFLMSENNGNLRVFSSSWRDRFFPLPVIDEQQSPEPVVVIDDGLGRHRLTILRESDDANELQQVAQLPNTDRPAAIGKPNEDIYSARFDGDRAYVVTFETIDPLYVIDLSDPTDPSIAGELEIPGFSTALQPVGHNLLLGIGHEVNPAAANTVQGVKLALFDVSNLGAPIILDERIIGQTGSSSPALYNYHSLSLLQTDTDYRLAIPISRHAPDPLVGNPNVIDYQPWADDGLYMFDVDPNAGTLTDRGKLILDRENEQQPYSNLNLYESRSILHNEAVFFIGDGEVHSLFWGDTQDVY